MALTVQSAVEFSLDTLCGVINRSFVGYVGGEVNFTPRILAGFLTQNSVSLTRSLIALSDGDPAGIALLARRGWSVRVAMMGVTADHQNKGVGRWLLGEIEREARENGDRTLVLEVIEQNPRAVHLYESCGFHKVRRLIGYNGGGFSGEVVGLVPVDVAEAARRISAWQPADTPWQCCGETLITQGTPSVAYRLGDCYAVVSNPAGETVVINGLAVPPDQQRQGKATQLVAALMAAHPGKTWRIVPICPEEYGEIFLRNGMAQLEINQFQMEKAVAGGG